MRDLSGPGHLLGLRCLIVDNTFVSEMSASIEYLWVRVRLESESPCRKSEISMSRWGGRIYKKMVPKFL